MKKRLITSALPYVNNIPHLGNLLQVLSADVFARFCRMKGYETLYICGTDEYGTATETKAKEEGIHPRELCDRYHVIHKEIYDWFGIAFDHFGRTSCDEQTQIVQDIFRQVQKHGYIQEHTITQLYSEASDMFLADRYVRGTCPVCSYEDARGDQCENCGKLLEPTELLNPRSAIDGTVPVLRETKHLYIDLPALKDKLEAWMKQASVDGFWSRNAIQMTQSWIRDGLKERAITRDLKWGIPVPAPGFEKKVFYVWFDAPIGYISMTAQKTTDWRNWWQNPAEVELYQFIGKDNIPFHTVIFPSSLLASGENWTMLHHMSSTEYLNYESGKFSKSKGIGVFGSDARDTGIPADVWRFYLFYNRPETSDFTFTWKDFQEKVNKELIGNLGNLVNRTLSFWLRSFGPQLPDLPSNHVWKPQSDLFWTEVRTREAQIAGHYDRADLRDAFRAIFELSDYGNKLFQDKEPWKLIKTDPESAKGFLLDLVYLVRDLAILVAPVMPASALEMLSFFGLNTPAIDWNALGKSGALPGQQDLQPARILFAKLEDDHIEAMRTRFAGSQAERQARDNAQSVEVKPAAKPQPAEKPKAKKEEPKLSAISEEDKDLSLEDRFAKRVELRVAKIVAIERHPDAEKLYIEKLDDGSGTERVIVSGLVPHYQEEELLGKQIILVANLKPAKLRGIMSQGMLLAASGNDTSGNKKVEVLFAPWAKPGDQVYLEGREPAGSLPSIDIDSFFDIPLKAVQGKARTGNGMLVVSGQGLGTQAVLEGELG